MPEPEINLPPQTEQPKPPEPKADWAMFDLPRKTLLPVELPPEVAEPKIVIPKKEYPPFSDAGKAAYVTLRDTNFENGIGARVDMVDGVAALFGEPLRPASKPKEHPEYEDDAQYISTLTPMVYRPRLAIESFLLGAYAMEETLKPTEYVVLTRGLMEGMTQKEAQAKVKESIEVLKKEIKTAYASQYDYVERDLAAQARGREQQ